METINPACIYTATFMLFLTDLIISQAYDIPQYNSIKKIAF